MLKLMGLLFMYHRRVNVPVHCSCYQVIVLLLCVCGYGE